MLDVQRMHFLTASNDAAQVVKNWLQDERLTASDLVVMVRDEYLVA